MEKLEGIEFARLIYPRLKKVTNLEQYEAEAHKLVERRSGITEATLCSSIFLLFGYNNNGILNQVFVTQGKSGGDENAHAQSLGILTSIALQHGIPPQALIRTLEGIRASVRPYEGEGDSRTFYTSIEDFMARRMAEYVNGRGESLDASKLKDLNYAQPVLSVPVQGSSTWKKLRFGNQDKPPLYMHLDENDQGFLIGAFFERGKSGGDESAHAESLGKLVSISLQYGLHPYRIVRSLEGMSSPSIIYADGHIYQSIEDAVGRSILDWYLERGVNLRESYNRIMANVDEEDPTKSLELSSNGQGTSIPDFDLEGIASKHIEVRVEPCPNCESTEYTKMEKPDTKGCFIYSCCGWEAGACH